MMQSASRVPLTWELEEFNTITREILNEGYFI